jgi:cellulose synthase operon protein C
MTSLPSPALKGSALEDFLTEAQEIFNEQTEDENQTQEQAQAALAARLSQQPCQADTMVGVLQLFRAWRQAGQYEEALRVIAQDGATVLAQSPPDVHAYDALALSFWHLEALNHTNDASVCQPVWEQTQTQLAAMAPEQQSDDDWQHLAHRATQMGHHEGTRQCQRARYALQLANPTRNTYRAWDHATLALRLGLSHADQGNHTEAQNAGQQAVDALTQAGADQDVNFNDWLYIGDGLSSMAPEQIGTVIQNTRRLVPDDFSMPNRRSIEVKLARLQARALAQQGQLEQALVWARQGYFALIDDPEEDAFGVLLFDWLVQANHLSEAAELAFYCAVYTRPSSGQHACTLAQHHANTPGSDPFWNLALASAATDKMPWVAGEQEPEAFAKQHLILAEQKAPQHWALALMRGSMLAETETNLPQALAFHEQAYQSPDCHLSGWTLWLLRMKVHGPTKALTLPMARVTSAQKCYELSNHIEDMHEQLPEGTEWPEAAAADMNRRYLEAGLQKFEAFFATGVGNYDDANVHTYSMLCNNLGINRYVDEAYDKAISLHEKGIASSPFAEHYASLMNCQRAKGDPTAFIDAADRLWRYANENGYSRHTPQHYIANVCDELEKLNRDKEIPIWLQRLNDWWTVLDDEEKNKVQNVYFHNLTFILEKLARTQAQDALAHIEQVIPQIRNLKNAGALDIAALTFERAKQFPRALELYQEALTFFESTQTNQVSDRTQTEKAIKRCEEQLGIRKQSKPKWKFW